MRIIGSVLLMSLVFPAFAAGQGVARSSVVVGVGDKIIHTTQTPIATVTMPPGTSDGIVRATPEQYGQNLLIQGLKRGEAKLLVESTAEKLSEVIHVIVVEKTLGSRYNAVVGALANVEGIERKDIFLGDQAIVITGTTFSAADHARCMSQEKGAPGKKSVSVVCAARLSSAIPAVLPSGSYAPLPNVSLREEFGAAPAGGMLSGAEGDSTWIAEARLGDVPVLLLSSKNRAALVARAAQFSMTLRRAIAEWKREADQRDRTFPVLVSARRRPNGYELTMVWRADQGTRGATLVDFTFDEMQKATMTSGSSSDRLVEWWAAGLQDAFRLYFMGSLPLRTTAGGGPDNALMQVYRKAVRLDASPFNRSNAPVRLARGFTSLRWAAGKDIFADFLTRIPASFQVFSGGAG